VHADPIDPDILLALARSHQDPEARARLADQVGAVLLTHGQNARLQAAEILITLLPRLEERVRAHLARRLAPSADVPHDLVRRLANDVIGVAYPILLDSPVLTETDLAAIVASRGVDHRLAIAQRPDLSEVVTTALVTYGPEDVIEKTLRNPSARFSPETFRTAARLARQIERLQGPLATRSDLPAELAQEILSFVSEEVRAQILQRLRPRAIRAGTLDPALAAQISAAIDRRRPVDGALLLATLRGGAADLFDSLLAAAIDAPVGSVRDALAQIPHRLLPAAAAFLGLSAAQLSHLWLHFRQARPAIGEEGIGISTVLSAYGALTRETAEHELRALLRMPAQRRRA
jgi:uncharacterized protein (DUF2336 family)